ncbi:MAG: dipeptidase [Parachlamydiaceae bacterium]
MKESLQNIIDHHQEHAIKDYCTFLSFQSISSEPKYKNELLRCVDWLRQYILSMGFKTELWQGKEGHPILFAHYFAGTHLPTLLIYNHYDVQPCDPLELWDTPPFEPTLREGEIYARGAQDNKGQCFYVLQGLKALLQRDGKLPINIKLCIEGEEEIGSTSLESILEEKKNELKADYLAIVDLGIPSPTTPAITLGIRGIITMDFELEGSSMDLHSGTHGGIAFNPIHGLIQVLNALRDEKGKIAIPHFYDDVEEITTKEKAILDFNFDEEHYRKEFCAETTGGEIAHSPAERNGLRPTIEINGISGGYTGAGFKTVIPAKASAKLSCRLVPNQNPDRIAQLIKAFLIAKTPKGLKATVQVHSGKGSAIRTNSNAKVIQAFTDSFKDVFKKDCQYILSGASIPIAAKLALASHAEMALIGLGLATDQIHSPNEHFGLDRLKKGALLIAKAVERLATS